MRVINKSDRSRYSDLADRNIAPGAKSADMDLANFTSALSDIISGCGKSFCIRMNNEERNMIHKLIALDKESRTLDYSSICKPQNPMASVMKRAAEEKAAKIASIEAARKREEAIVSETTYASRKDIDAAMAKSLSMRGDIPAKKLDKKADEPVSLNDLIGNNKFIEESMKYSNIKTTVASEEGWDMDTMNASTGNKAKEPATADEPPATENDTGNTEAEEKPAKKTSRRRRKEESKQ